MGLGLVFSSCGAFATTEILAVNGSASNTLGVVTSAGVCVVPAGSTLVWPVEQGDWNTNQIDGTNWSSWYSAGGSHQYLVALNAVGQVVVGDSSGESTAWFWWGFAFAFGSGLFAVSATWVKRIMGGGGDPGGYD